MPNRICHSLLVRAKETATQLKVGLALEAPLVPQENLAPFDDPSPIADAIGNASESLMIVGHEPNLSLFSSLLLAGTDALERIVFPKASILCLSRLAEGSQSAPWQIEWHINHRLFET